MKIIIFGTGAPAQLSRFYFSDEGKHETVAFCVDAEYRKEDSYDGLPLVASDEITKRYPPGEFGAFIAMGFNKMNDSRTGRYQFMKKLGYPIVSYVSPYCRNFAASIGENCFILEDNTLQPFVTIGNNVTLWSGNHIGHHSKIGDNCFITSHVVVSGGVTVENNCFIGVNASLRDGIRIGRYSLISAGALIVHDTEEYSVYKAERSKRHEKRSDEMGL